MKLWKYQEAYLATLPASCIMHADLGTGKTLMSLAHWQRQATGRPLLVIAPASKVRTGDWQAEAERWFGPGVNTAWPNITYISYEKLRLNNSKTNRPNWWEFVAGRNGGIVYDVIADECAALKNPQAKQSKAVFEIKLAGGLFVGLSGTPMSNGWIDFAGYSKLFGFTKGITEFKKKYCIITTYGGFPKIQGYLHTGKLQKQWSDISRSLTRDQAAELPSRRFIGKTIILSSKEQKAYIEAKALRYVEETGVVLDNPSLLLNYLRQVGTASRLDELSDVLDGTAENIVIFYNYISERKAILAHIAKHHKNKTVLRYDGEAHSKLPASDAELQDVVLLAHYKSASTGLNLQWANVTVYFSLTYSYQEFEQSIGRTHRTGQTKKCLYYVFAIKNTVDRDIWSCLRNKKSFSEKLWYSNVNEEKE